jgi:hypothetical protein
VKTFKNLIASACRLKKHIFATAAVQFVVTLPPRGPSAIRSINFEKPLDALIATHCNQVKQSDNKATILLTASSFRVKENNASLAFNRSWNVPLLRPLRRKGTSPC